MLLGLPTNNVCKYSFKQLKSELSMVASWLLVVVCVKHTDLVQFGDLVEMVYYREPN